LTNCIRFVWMKEGGVAVRVLYIGEGEDGRIPSFLQKEGHNIEVRKEAEAVDLLIGIGVSPTLALFTLYQLGRAVVIEQGVSSLTLTQAIRNVSATMPIVYVVWSAKDIGEMLLALDGAGADSVIFGDEPEALVLARFNACVRRVLA